MLRIAALLLCLALPARAEVPVLPVPGWVEPVELPEFPADLYRHIRDGEAFHLLDRQVTWRDGRRLTYVRFVIEAVNRSALERVATIARDYDPEIETMALLHADILRGGQRIALADRLHPTEIRREARLDAGIIDGTLTAHYDLPGVQVGDLVDVAFLWDSGEYLPRMNREVSMDLEFDVPVGLSRLLVHWPAGPPPLVRAPPELLVSITDEPGGQRLEWRRGALPPEEPEPATDDVEALYDSVHITAQPDWEAVSHQLTDYYTTPRTVPEAWTGRVEAIRDDNASPTARAFAALRLVQDEIRYVGLEVGAGGYFAREPEQVVAKAFGDCKDKALLLKTLLEALGIEAEVALASLDGGYELKDALPQASAFDHMIVGARLRGRWVWMDPTESYQGGVGEQALEPDLGWVLPVSKGQDDLTLIDERRPRWSRRMLETFTFSPGGATLDVVTRLTGASAAAERETWDTKPVSQIAAGYMEYYSYYYPGIRQVAEPEFQDSGRSNITVRESYLIPGEALRDPALWREFPFASEFGYSPYPSKAGPRRTALRVPHSTVIEHQIIVRNAPINFEPPPEIWIENGAFRSHFKASAPRDGGLTMDWSYRTLSRSVPPEAVAEVLDEAEEARRMRAFYWDFGDPDASRSWLDRLLEGMSQDR